MFSDKTDVLSTTVGTVSCNACLSCHLFPPPLWRNGLIVNLTIKAANDLTHDSKNNTLILESFLKYL